MSSRGPVLPPELFDETLDHLWDDAKTLRVCSLVCRSWVPSTRLHLFRTIRLSSEATCTQLSALMANSPAIARCVRKLTISAQYSGVGTDNRGVEDDAWVNVSAEIARTLGVHGRVNTLALSRLRWTSLAPDTRDAYKAVFKGVRTLLLFEVRFHASGDVLDFLDAFPDLEELYFHAVSWDSESSTTPSSAAELISLAQSHHDTKKMHLSYLFLDPRSSPTLVTEWILSHPSEQKLRTIQLCWRELDNTKALGDLLQASGSSLERLQIEFPSGIAEETVLHNHVSLVHNTALRSLSFGGLDVTLASARTFLSAHLFPWVALMLADLQSPHLREVTFELETPDAQGLAGLDWPRIDAELAKREFQGLTVRFYVNCDACTRGSKLEDEVRDAITERLPGFKDRGTLRVSCI
ncbi:F-box protein [Phanerochaete sordida]|uniref:F-box protein n=1 Tax=Phanerochaete sordida TaxID=48140 RepID=A0A9P3LCS2_9APHY|nr:F-box protein [Phanerochaete sordida]